MARAKKTAAPAATNDMDIARKIWLAGVGAYGRVFAETQEQAQKLAKDAGEAFEQLVVSGEAMEDLVRARIAATPQAGKVVGLVNDMAKRAKQFREERQAVFVERMAEARKTIEAAVAPFNPTTTKDTLETLAADVAALRAELAALKGEKPARRARATATVVKAAPAKARAAKAVVRKPRAKKA